MMKVYDSRSKSKTEFLKSEQVFKLYVCGLTVYDQAHIGHLRTMLVFDLLVKVMRQSGYSVQYVRNITDVDDKIIKRANERNISCEALTQEVIADVARQEGIFHLIQPDVEPKASEYIPQMIAMIEQLITKGHAYVSDSGDVCFSVASYPEYGQLSKQKIDALVQAARIDQGGKQSAHDFVLWKQAKPQEPSWDSPWGLGRPGWHIECSAMSCDIFGDTFDLHGGGLDLKFPHHENEIAQACCATGGDFAQNWMHVSPLLVDGEKMSKSLGNFITVADALKRYDSEVICWYMLKTHYRQPLDFSEQGMLQAQRNVLNFYLHLKVEVGVHDANDPDWIQFLAYLADDLNIAEALSLMHRYADGMTHPNQRATLLKMLNILGVGYKDPVAFLQFDTLRYH